MKRNRFQLVLVPAVSSALLAFGCGRPSASTDSSRVCIDAQGRRVADDQCRDGDLPTNRSTTFYHWYYHSYGGSIPIGGFVSGHSFSHGSTSQPSNVTRGGFGSSAHSRGAGA